MTPAPLSQPHSRLQTRLQTRRAFLGTGLTVVGGLTAALALPGTAFAAQDETKYFPLVLSPWLYADATPQRAVLALSAALVAPAQTAINAAGFASVQGHLESILSRDGMTTLQRLVAHALDGR